MPTFTKKMSCENCNREVDLSKSNECQHCQHYHGIAFEDVPIELLFTRIKRKPKKKAA